MNGQMTEATRASMVKIIDTATRMTPEALERYYLIGLGLVYAGEGLVRRKGD